MLQPPNNSRTGPPTSQPAVSWPIRQTTERDFRGLRRWAVKRFRSAPTFTRCHAALYTTSLTSCVVRTWRATPNHLLKRKCPHRQRYSHQRSTPPGTRRTSSTANSRAIEQEMVATWRKKAVSHTSPIARSHHATFHRKVRCFPHCRNSIQTSSR